MTSATPTRRAVTHRGLAPGARRWTVAALVLTCVDAVSTWHLVGSQGMGEANPLMLSLIDAHGLADAMLIRTIIGGCLVLALAGLTRASRLALHGLWLITGALAMTACWHLVLQAIAISQG